MTTEAERYQQIRIRRLLKANVDLKKIVDDLTEDAAKRIEKLQRLELYIKRLRDSVCFMIKINRAMQKLHQQIMKQLRDSNSNQN